MRKENEFIGGRFPKAIAEAIKERAAASNMSITEYVETIFMKELDDDGDGLLTEAEYQQLIEREVHKQVGDLSIAMKQVAEQPQIETVTNESEEFDEFIEEEEVSGIVPGVPVSVVGGLTGLGIKPLLSRELSGLIVQAWKATQEISKEPVVVIFFETLSGELQEVTDRPISYNPEGAEYFKVLPLEIVERLDPIIVDVVLELDGELDRNSIYQLLSQLLTDRANTLFLEGQAVKLTFNRSEFDVLDRLFQQINEDRPAGSRFSNLQAFLLHRLGEELETSGKGLFGPRDRQMLQFGQQLKRRALGKSEVVESEE